MKHLLLLCILIGCTPLSKKLRKTAIHAQNSQVPECYERFFNKMVNMMEKEANAGKFDVVISFNCVEIVPEIDKDILHDEILDLLWSDYRLKGLHIIPTNIPLTFFFSWRSS